MPGVAAKADVKILSIDYSLAPEAMFPVHSRSATPW